MATDNLTGDGFLAELRKTKLPDFDKDEYNVWASMIEKTLTNLGIFEILNNASDKEPTNCHDCEDSELNDELVVLLLNCMDKLTRREFHNYTSAHKIWVELKNRYVAPEGVDRVGVLRKLVSLVYICGESVDVHIAELNRLFGQLNALGGPEMTDELKIDILVTSLPNEYEHVKDHLEQSKEEMSIGEAFSEVRKNATRSAAVGEKRKRAGVPKGKKNIGFRRSASPGTEQDEDGKGKGKEKDVLNIFYHKP